MLFLPRLGMPNFDDSPREALPASEDSEESMGWVGMGVGWGGFGGLEKARERELGLV